MSLSSHFDRKTQSFKRKGLTYPIIGLIIGLIVIGAVAAQAHNRASFMRLIHFAPKFTPAPFSVPTSLSELKEKHMSQSSPTSEPTSPSPTPSDTAKDSNGNSSVSIHVENNNGTSHTSVSSSNSSTTTVTGTKNSKVTTTGDAQVHQDPDTGTTTVDGKNFSVKITDGGSSKVNVSNHTSSSTRVRTSISNHTTSH